MRELWEEKEQEQNSEDEILFSQLRDIEEEKYYVIRKLERATGDGKELPLSLKLNGASADEYKLTPEGASEEPICRIAGTSVIQLTVLLMITDDRRIVRPLKTQKDIWT